MMGDLNNLIIAWCNSNEQLFENHVPLRFVGERNQKLGLSNNVNVLFLEGFNLLSELYKSALQQVGYVLHDVSAAYDALSAQYTQLNRFGDYEKKCFLRWLVIDKIFAGEGIIHYDGDIVFNEDPQVIERKLAGKTFVLQGCPAFTVVSNQAWFAQYKKNLDLFVRDIEGYSQKAWQERSGWEVTFKTRWAGSRFRPIITSDQDFLSHLIHAGQIQQDSVESVSLALQDYVFFENPLFIHFYDDNFPYHYKRECGIDYFYGVRRDGQDCVYKKKILFWHMQSCFNFYLSKFVLRKKILPFLPLGRLNLDLSGFGFEDKINRRLAPWTKHTTRLAVYSYFFAKADFSGVFKDSVWWKKGMFD